MALVLSKKPTFKFEVEYSQPDENGKWQKFTFLGEFKRHQEKALQDLIKNPPTDAELVADDVDAEHNVFVGWSGVKCMVQVDGKDVEQDMKVTPANRLALLAEPQMRRSIVLAYMKAVLVGPAKN